MPEVKETPKFPDLALTELRTELSDLANRLKRVETENTRKIGSLEMQIDTLHKELKESRHAAISSQINLEVQNQLSGIKD